MSNDQRQTILNAEVATYAGRGWTVASVTPTQAILQRNKRIGWFWNLILAILTGGLWLIVVVIRLINRKKESLVISVDSYGRVSVSSP